MKSQVLLLLLIIAVAFSQRYKLYEKDRITKLPGVSLMPWARMYSGYLDSGNGDQMFYWFNEADSGNERLILWLNGGPGCSSLFGLMKENGPFVYNSVTKTLEPNKHSWNRLGATLYLDSPVGTGFSHTKGNTSASDLNDEKTAKSLLKALKHFYTLYPTFQDNELYLSGESYAGIYLPLLAAEILKENGSIAKNLKGLILGNPHLSEKDTVDSQEEYLYGHGFIGRPLYEELKRCRTGEKKRGCGKAKSKLRDLFYDKSLPLYNIAKDSACKVEFNRPLYRSNQYVDEDYAYNSTDYNSDYDYNSTDYNLTDYNLTDYKPPFDLNLTVYNPTYDYASAYDYNSTSDDNSTSYYNSTSDDNSTSNYNIPDYTLN